MKFRAGNIQFSTITLQRRLWAAYAFVLPKLANATLARNKISRLKILAHDLTLKEPIQIVDVGSNPLGYDTPYQSLLDAELCQITGFEPQSDALEELNLKKTDAETYFSDAIGDGKEHVFTDYISGGWSSLLTLDPSSLGVFYWHLTVPEVKTANPVLTRRLDDIDEIEAIDFLKIDIQGGELMVFENARKKLRDAIAIQTEVSMLRTYYDQPSFGDVDRELTKQGFDIHTIIGPHQMGMDHSQRKNLSEKTNRQLLDEDVIYIRDIRNLAGYTSIKLKKLSVLADAVFDSVELTIRCIDILSGRGEVPANLAEQYRKLLPVHCLV